MPGQQTRSVLLLQLVRTNLLIRGDNNRRKNVRRKLNAMALEFSGKNVLIVDGELANLTQMTLLLSDSANNARFYCARHDFQRNRADGQRCGCKEGHRCKLRASHPVSC